MTKLLRSKREIWRVKAWHTQAWFVAVAAAATALVAAPGESEQTKRQVDESINLSNNEWMSESIALLEQACTFCQSNKQQQMSACLSASALWTGRRSGSDSHRETGSWSRTRPRHRLIKIAVYYLLATMSFFQRVFHYVLNETVVTALANKYAL